MEKKNGNLNNVYCNLYKTKFLNNFIVVKTKIITET